MTFKKNSLLIQNGLEYLDLDLALLLKEPLSPTTNPNKAFANISNSFTDFGKLIMKEIYQHPFKSHKNLITFCLFCRMAWLIELLFNHKRSAKAHRWCYLLFYGKRRCVR